MGSSLSLDSTTNSNHHPRVMGSATTTRCEPNQRTQAYEEAPPVMYNPKSMEEKMYEKFRKEPLVPMGCLMTAYFLMSGIKSFKNRDPRRAQKMMRARVGAQFATLAAFVGYMGTDNVNFDVMPAYYRAKKEEDNEEEKNST